MAKYFDTPSCSLNGLHLYGCDDKDNILEAIKQSQTHNINRSLISYKSKAIYTLLTSYEKEKLEPTLLDIGFKYITEFPCNHSSGNMYMYIQIKK